MKITRSQLKKLIKEEIALLNETPADNLKEEYNTLFDEIKSLKQEINALQSTDPTAPSSYINPDDLVNRQAELSDIIDEKTKQLEEISNSVIDILKKEEN